MIENDHPGEEPVKSTGPRTITITLPSWSGLGAAFVAGVLLVSLALGGVWGYRHLEHGRKLEAARSEMAKFFQEKQAKASSLLEEVGRDAAQLQSDLSAALMATKSSSISPAEFAARQQGLVQDLASVQAVFAEIAEREQSLIQSAQLSAKDVLFSQDNQKQFNQLQKQWGDLNQQQGQLVNMLQDVAVRKDSLVATEQKAMALAAAKKQALAQSQARARAAQSRQNAPTRVFGAPSYYNYSGNYYTAPIYAPNYYPRPYGGGYGYGPGYGPASVGVGFYFP